MPDRGLPNALILALGAHSRTWWQIASGARCFVAKTEASNAVKGVAGCLESVRAIAFFIGGRHAKDWDPWPYKPRPEPVT